MTTQDAPTSAVVSIVSPERHDCSPLQAAVVRPGNTAAVRLARGADSVARSGERMTSWYSGWPLYLAVIALTAAIIPFGYWAALGLLVLVLVTPAIGKR